MLEAAIRARRARKDILLMTHIVLGYPNFDDCMRLAETMVGSGVDLMELQIPFSEPIADGPVILRANQAALHGGARVDDCLSFAERLTERFDIPFVFMSYYNIPFTFGVDAFAERMRRAGVQGAIVPDLPPEEAGIYLPAMRRRALAPVFIYSPNTSDARMRMIAREVGGFVYCVARKGVTGADTDFAGHLCTYLERCRRATQLPLALGFGVREAADVDFLRGRVDIAVVGTQTIRVFDEGGVDAVGAFLRGLR